MPAYKDEEKKTWYCKFYYKDWTGQNKQKLKRGFKREKDAKEWERDFLSKQQENPNMNLKSLCELYIEDVTTRLRESTMMNKKLIIEYKILPYFSDMPICEIKPTHIRKWQNELMKKGYSDTYLKFINGQLVTIFNYASKYYGLKENPCHKAGSMGTMKSDEMLFWTRDEFSTFIECVSKPQYKIACEILYWTGMRMGEVLALTLQDINFDDKTIIVNKSIQRLNKKDIITPPKTPKSNRVIPITDFLSDDIRAFTNMLYDIKDSDRLFTFNRSAFHYEINRVCKKTGLKKIRVHDLRHSHASLLIELGFSPLLIRERLGHEKVETTLNTYSHLYPNKQNELIVALEKMK